MSLSFFTSEPSLTTPISQLSSLVLQYIFHLFLHSIPPLLLLWSKHCIHLKFRTYQSISTNSITPIFSNAGFRIHSSPSIGDKFLNSSSHSIGSERFGCVEDIALISKFQTCIFLLFTWMVEGYVFGISFDNQSEILAWEFEVSGFWLAGLSV